MMRIGYTLMTEQAGPKDLIRHAVRAEQAGFDFEVMSDHYSPWLTEQGHAPYAWSVLGAIAHATGSVDLMTYVTCPSIRYHPVVIAQKAATMQILADGRFTLGLGTGECLNEHVVGDGWPSIDARMDMLEEAVAIIRALHSGDLVSWKGKYFDVQSARIWDLPEIPVPLAIAMSGDKSVERFGPMADDLIGVAPDSRLVHQWKHVHGRAFGLPPARKAVGQIPISWDDDRDVAVARAHQQFRWFGLGWPVNSELPTPAGFAAASQFVRKEDVAENIPCGPDLDAIVEAVKAYKDAGFTDVALIQIGGDTQDRFFDEAAKPLLEALHVELG